MRRLGKSYAHPLVVLVSLPGEQDQTHLGVSAGRSVGGAVQRNRAKRVLRAAVSPLLEQVPPGWEIVLVARKPLLDAPFSSVQNALRSLLVRAALIMDKMDSDLASEKPLQDLEPPPVAEIPHEDDHSVPEPRLRDLSLRLENWPRFLLLALIRFYQVTFSRLLPPDTCRFYPSCSHYGYQAIYKYGALKGSWLTIWRILRCNPFNRGGFDPVP